MAAKGKHFQREAKREEERKLNDEEEQQMFHLDLKRQPFICFAFLVLSIRLLLSFFCVWFYTCDFLRFVLDARQENVRFIALAKRSIR